MKQFKQKLILLLSTTSLLATSLLSMSFNNKYYQSNNGIAGGFHITVKSSNRNLVNSIKSWNNDSQYLYDNINTNPLNIDFDSYDQIISNDWTSSSNESKLVINDKGYNELENIIKNNNSNFKNAEGFFTGSAFGNTFNVKSNNLIVQYHQAINESVDGGIFKTIYAASEVKTLMAVPYNLQPSLDLQHAKFETRAKMFPIGPFPNTNNSFSNEIFIFYVHPPFKKSGLVISTNNKRNEPNRFVKTNSNNTFDYAILNQDDSTNIPTTYHIKWNDDDSTVLKTEKVMINSSAPNVQITNNELKDKPSLIHQYFINNEQNSNLQITAFSQIQSTAIITPNISNDKWTYQRVDDRLLPIDQPKPIPEQPLTPYQSADHTIYLLQRIINNKIDSSSLQYLNIYNMNPLAVKFAGLTSFVDSQSGLDFNQYLREATNIKSSINDLDPGQLRYWLLFYEHDLLNHWYANITNDGNEYQVKNNNPFALPELQLKLTTLVNNWNIIIIGSTILLIIITIPLVMAVSRKKKIKK